MLNRILPLTLAGLALILAATPAPSAEGESALTDELAVKSAGLPVDPSGLLEFLRTRTKGDGDPTRLAALLQQLDSKSAADREKATAELVAIGPPSIPYLRKALKDPDSSETAGLARQCLRAIELESPTVTSAVVRLLAIRRPDGAVQALLNYLPSAEDETVLEEVKNALAGMAYTAGKPDPALLKSLEDDAPLRRAAAIDALCSNGSAEPRAALRKLLADPTPTVRLRAALALASARDAKAVSTLIALLGELPITQGRYAEEFLVGLASDQAPNKATLTDDESRGKVKDAWAAWWLDTEDPEKLIPQFTKRTLTEDARAKAEELVKKLGDEVYQNRQDAKDEIKKLGVVVIPMLKTAVNNSDLEVSQSAKLLLQEIEKDKTPLSPVWPRLIALRKPAKGVEAMLAYLPFCDDEGLVAEIQTALNAVAYDGAKPNAALLRALADKAAVRRGAAAEALCFGDLGENKAPVKNLLKDDSTDVRLQVALALAGARDSDAVPVLIEAIGAMPAAQSEKAEDYLLRVAAERPPLNLPGGDDARAKRQEMWAEWWKENGTKVALVDRYAPGAVVRDHGYLLIVEAFVPGRQGGRVVELDAAKKERWKIDNLQNPQDAQALPGGRVLIIDNGGQRVSERDSSGKVVWEKNVPTGAAFRCQRLKNGGTFVACRNSLVEWDREGKEVSNKPFQNDTILDAQKMRDGSVEIVTYSGAYSRTDASGKEVKTGRVPFNPQFGVFGGEVLPNDHVIMSTPDAAGGGKVTEYDADGKMVWAANVQQANTFFRMSNGHTLAASQNFAKIYEIDQTGKIVNESKDMQYRPWRVSRR
jgi:HEAT repeat protein